MEKCWRRSRARRPRMARHSRRRWPRSLDRAGITLKDLHGIAVGIGPGSFTGLRVGLAYAKGLVFALECALIGISSFDCLALAAFEQCHPVEGTLICPIVDARKGEVYANIYRARADRLDNISQPLVIKLQNLFPELSDGVILIGDSKAKEASLLLSERGIQSTVLDEGSELARPVCRGTGGGEDSAR